MASFLILSGLAALWPVAQLHAEPPAAGRALTLELSAADRPHAVRGVAVGYAMDYFAEEPGQNHTIETIRAGKPGDATAPDWQPVGTARANFGFQNSAYWLRFTVRNPDDREREFLLEARYPMLDDLRLYIPNSEGYTERRTGDRLRFAERELDFHHMVFRVTQPAASERIYYLRVQSESSMNATLILWTPEAFERYGQSTTQILSMLYAVLAIMLAFNFLLYVSLRERAYLFFTGYLAAITLFLFTLDGLAFQYLWPEWPTWGNISLPLWMNLSYVSGLVFARHYLRTSRDAPILDRVILLEIYVAAGLAVTAFFVPYMYSIVIATALAVLIAASIVVATFAGILQGRRSAYYFGMAWTMVLAGIFLYSLKSFAILPDTFWTNWSIHAGVVLQVVLLSLGLADRINALRIDLRQRLADLRAAGRSIRSSENKYKHLVESSGDIIFSMSADGVILTANRAIQPTLGLRPTELIGTSFESLLYRSPELEEILPDTDIQRELIAREIKELIRTGNPAVFKAEFATMLGEPRQLDVRLERVPASPADSKKSKRERAPGKTNAGANETDETGDDKHVILGKAAVVLEDSIVRFVEAERQVHVIGNFLNIADLITERVVKNLEKFTDSSAKLGIHICVREMIINAIEHGNLAVSYDEKTTATDRESYMELLTGRQKDPRYRNRKVTVIYSLNRKRVWYRIRDEGGGFDHRKLFAKDPNAPNSEGLAHGRGITMARNIFDSVRYNDVGNQVTLIKRFD
ncbi:MAG: ATP-binding protein [bacterium]|nr:ATP-binding protein [bacterium]